MFEIPFGILLREAREQMGLSGRELAQLIGRDYRRLSALEKSLRFPTPQEVDAFLAHLPLDSSRVHFSLNRPPESLRLLTAKGERLLGGPPYFPPAPEPAFRRFRAAFAAFPRPVREMTERLRKRADFLQIFRLTRNMRFDSADEVLNALHILDVGAVPALHPPNACAAPPARIVDKAGKRNVGHRPHACLILQNLAIFHQVTLATARLQTVDLLVWDGVQWIVWEIFGAAHDDRKDEDRRQDLGIPVYHFKTEVIERAALRREPYFGEFLQSRRAA